MTSPHVEVERVPGRRLGRRKPIPGRPLLRLGDILTGVVPDHSPGVDHFSRVTDWGLYGNDRFGDCGPVSVANARKLTTTYLGRDEQSPGLNDVFTLYRASGNPNFNPQTGADDNGVIMADMLSAILKDGIGGIRGVAYAAVDVSSLDEVRAAIDIFGFLLLGVDLQAAQQSQTNAHLWDYRPSGEWGGHAVLAGTYTSAARGADISVITWAEVVGTTDAFWQHQVEEAYVLIWPEHFGSTAFREGVDLNALAAAFQALTGRQLPVPTKPVPPVPMVAPYFAGSARATTFHDAHPGIRRVREFQTYDEACAAGLRPCRICRPKP